MLETIKETLLNIKEIAGWKLIENEIESSELFLLKDQLDMNRAKIVKKYSVTVYKDFIENNIKYRGSASVDIYPTMSRAEIKRALEEACIGAGYVNNKYYPLVKPQTAPEFLLRSNFNQHPFSYWLPKFMAALYPQKENYINSAEVFLSKIKTRILNSAGVDVEYQKYKCDLEFITTWKEKDEEVELYKQMSFSNFNKEAISNEVATMLQLARERIQAIPTPSLENLPVLLTGEPVKEFFKYYYYQTSARQVYEKISTINIGDHIQGKDIKGDSLKIVLDPFLEGSTASAPYDKDGFPLKSQIIIDEGTVQKYWGDYRHAYYLDIEPTGKISNIIVEGGEHSLATLKTEPHLELLAFSDFQMDPLTGDFAGEIRLGRFYDGNSVIPVTGGALSGNIKKVHHNMYLSTERQQLNNFVGPQSVMLWNVTISGS